MRFQIVKFIVRDILKMKHSSAINLIGLSIGFAVLIAITFFIREELNYNQFHENIDNIYSVYTKDNTIKDGLGWNESVPAMAEALRTEYPEVRDAALYYGGTLRMLFNYDGANFYEQVQMTDPNLFNIFSFPILKGKIPQNANEQKTIALSRKFATKYFGEQNPIGKSIKINNEDIFNVVAVFEDIPKNSSIRFNVWMPIKQLENFYGDEHLDTWYNLSFSCYALLNNNIDLEKLNSSLLNRIQQSNPDSQERSYLYPFTDMYLKAWNHNKGIRMMSMIAAIILVLVCLNFINLQTAEAFVKIKQFGIKKINGARNFEITKQLVLQALLYCFIAIVIAVGIIWLSSSHLSNILGKTASDGSMISVNSMLLVVLVAILMSLLSGIIPGLTIRNITPTNAIRNNIKEQLSVKKLRVVFTSLQFAMAIILIICLFATNKQLTFLRNKNLGFNRDQVVYVHLEGELLEKQEILREELSRNASIVSVSCASRSPIGIYWNGGGWEWEDKPADLDPMITFIETDEYFQQTFEIALLEGEYIKSDVPKVVINETFAQMISPNESALNKVLSYPEEGLNVAVGGIIKDIHFKPLNREITPLMIIPKLGYDPMKYIFIKLSPTHIDKTLSFIDNTIMQLNPGFPSEHFFLDNDFNRLYKGEQRLRDQMMFFSIMAILISCMGLWGILLFMVKQRIKEIGIRKVNGAKVSEILSMLNKDFIKWVAIAFVLACPIAYYAMNKWLENFAYKTSLSWWIFAMAGVLALGIALLTVSLQSYKAAIRNPIESLRYE